MDEHLIELEIKISHHEMAIEQLERTVFEQHAQLEKIEKALQLLGEKFAAQTSGPEIGPGNEKPPHY